MSDFASWDSTSAFSAGWLAAAGPGMPRQCKAGQLIYAQGDPAERFYFLHAGYVRATMARPDGQTLLLEIFGPGTLFGEGAAFEHGPRYVTTTTATDCTLGVYDAAEVRARVEREPALAMELVRIMSAKQRSLALKAAGLSGSGPEERVVELLKRMLRLRAQGRPGARVELTHEEMASMTGLSRVTVTRVLKELSEQGLLTTQRGKIEVPPGSALLEAGPAAA